MLLHTMLTTEMNEEPEVLHIVGIETFRDPKRGSCANITWNSPTKNSKMAKNHTGTFEVWWGPVTKPVELVSWFYQFSGNVSIIRVDPVSVLSPAKYRQRSKLIST